MGQRWTLRPNGIAKISRLVAIGVELLAGPANTVRISPDPAACSIRLGRVVIAVFQTAWHLARMEPTPTYRADIDGLRAIAVLSVLFHHLDLPGFSGGYVGVDIFFVISGFLITRIIVTDVDAGTFKFSRFYSRRVRRLFPALVATLALTFVFGFLLLSPEHLQTLSRSGIYALTWLSNFLFYSEVGYFDLESRFKPLLHTWSLSVEEQYYLVWPVTLVALSTLKRRWMPIAALGVLLCLGVALSEIWLRLDPAGAFFLLPARIFEFAIGGLLVWIVRWRPAAGRAAEIGAGLGLVMLALSIVALSPATPFPGVAALLPCVGAALIIWCGQGAKTAGLLRSRPTVWIGKISYSLYLVHWPIIVYFSYWKFGDPTLTEKAALALASLAIAWLMYRLVETPFRYPSGATWIPRHLHPITASAAAVVLAVSALALSVDKGLAWRVSAIQTVETNPADFLTNECRRIDLPISNTICSVGDPYAEPAFAIVGDSHAQALATGFDQIGREIGASAVLFNQGGTLPFLGARVYDGSEYRGVNFDDSLRYLLENGPETIIVHARFSMYWLTDRGNRTPDNRRKYVGVDGGPLPSSIEESQANFQATLEQTVQVLSASGKRVIIVGAVPHLGVNIRPCVTRPTYLFDMGRIMQQCGGFTRQQSVDRASGVNAVLEQAATEAGFTFVDPIDWLCPLEESMCRKSQGGRLLYRDHTHLSDFGAASFFRAHPELIEAR